MSAFSNTARTANPILTSAVTDVFGFGATLNPDGSLSAIGGATIRYVTAAPTQTDPAGSLALRSNGTLYSTTGSGTWVAIGGGGSGWNLPDNISGIWGTTTPLQVSSVYVSATKLWNLLSANWTSALVQGGLPGSVGYSLASGTAANTGAVVGWNSGGFAFATGNTTNSDAGGTGGASGSYSWTSGNAASAAGLSGNSGGFTWASGTSEEGATGGYAWTTGAAAVGNSGGFTFTTGTAGGARGGMTWAFPDLATTAQAFTWNLINNSATALQVGSSGLASVLTVKTTTGAQQVVARGLQTTSTTAGAITAVTVLTIADSGGVFSVSQAAAYDIDLPSPTVGSGLRYLFYLTGPAANNVTITVAGGAATFVGTIQIDGATTLCTGATLTFTSGNGTLGDNIEIVSISASLYLVRAVGIAAGSITIT